MLTHVTAASVLAWVAVTLVDLQFTVGAPESWPAGARVTALAGVGAGGPVGAWLVVGAVVQVLIAEQTSPAFLADALPRLTACSMEAAWVAHTLIAVRPLPPQAALAVPRGLAVAMCLAAVR